MPFDSLMVRSLDQRPAAPLPRLEAAAARLGLQLLDLELLERHKAAELQRHAPSWAYRHRTALRLAFGLTMVAGLVGFAVLGLGAVLVLARHHPEARAAAPRR